MSNTLFDSSRMESSFSRIGTGADLTRMTKDAKSKGATIEGTRKEGRVTAKIGDKYAFIALTGSRGTFLIRYNQEFYKKN